MKKSCKNIDIKKPDVIEPFIFDCLHRHWKNGKYQRLLHRLGAPAASTPEQLHEAAASVARYVAQTIADRSMPQFCPRAWVRADRTTGKPRLIGSESALQQCYDYVAVYACQELWRRRFLGQQCSSIKDRGQLYGTRLIRSYILKDLRASHWAKKHGRRYTPQCKYFCKLDIKKCYPSVDKAILLQLLEHDLGNPDLLYLWQEILAAHGRLNTPEPYTGLLIGALPSQWAAQYLMSFICRYALSLDISHLVTFMDDMVAFGSNRRKLKKSIEELCRYAQEKLHLTIKDTWQIKRLGESSIDMMGFVVHASGKATIRARNFIRSRRLVLRAQERGHLDLRSAKRLTSYKGYYIYSDSERVCQKLKTLPVFKMAQRVISAHERRIQHADLL